MREKQPNSRYCFVCGLENPFGLQLEFYETGPNEVTTEFTAPDRYQGYPGVLHGGVVTALLDEVAGRAFMGVDPDNTRFMYTARLTVRFRNNVPIGQPLKIVGRAVKDRRNAGTAQTVIYDADSQVLAEAEALLVEVPEADIQSADLAALGWRVYPDLHT